MTKKQLRQTKLVPVPARIAVHKYPSRLTVNLDWFGHGTHPTSIDCHWEAMQSTDYMHTFVIPVDLTRSLQAALATARKEQYTPDELDANTKKQGIVLDLVATIDPKLWKMRGNFVSALTGFHAIKTKIQVWFEDRKWLEQDWRKVSSNVSLFTEETNTWVCEEMLSVIATDEVIAKFTSSRLRTEFATLSGKGTISFENIFGGLCRGWLNDSHVDFCLKNLVIRSVVIACYRR
ncbi:hypothetical protein PC128_g12310 [Phytophthora cactorum]|nr:hypothetical protein PC120_g7396 [Phytophthora cactorum]KAG3075155.1 hypothetical protein PC121_g8149 [Phytophthora cactorum]KAG3188170.1 hypothetical protein PC128_g12310 [Phytophthora cactorum]